MRYIRFLKPPKTDGRSITALITITSDLGDSFLAEDVTLMAGMIPDGAGEASQRKQLIWTAGMRSLSVVFHLPSIPTQWPVRMHVGTQRQPVADSFDEHYALSKSACLISAWSAPINPPQGINEAEKLVERRFSLSNDTCLHIWEETGESIARHVWDAGIGLCVYLDRIVDGRANGLPLLAAALTTKANERVKVLELGSGCGIVGIGLTQLLSNCEVVLTDLPEAAEIAQRNVEVANSSSVRFEVVDWDEALPASVGQHPFDVVLVADCTYNPDSSPSLVRTLAAVAGRSPDTVVVVAMKVRHASEAVFFDLMGQAGFAVRETLSQPLPTEASSEEEHVDMFVFQIRP